MKAKITDFIHHLLIYDYLLFGGIFILFILLLTIAIILRHRLGLAIFFVFIAFGILTAGPIMGYLALHSYLFKNKIILHEIKTLEFTEALLIKGDINNTSKHSFKECTIKVGVHKVTHNQYIDKIYPYVPFKRSSMILTESISPGDSTSFKFLVEPFSYHKDFNITIKADCK